MGEGRVYISRDFSNGDDVVLFVGKKESRKGGAMSSSQEDESSWGSSMDTRPKHKGLARVRTSRRARATPDCLTNASRNGIVI